MTLDAALAQLQTGNPKKAATLLRQVVVQSPGDPDALNLLGMAALDVAGDQSLPPQLARSLAVVPDDPLFLRNLGLASLRREQLRQAGTSLRKSLVLIPDQANAHLDFGNLVARYGDYASAWTQYARAVSLAPGDAGARLNRGWATLALGDFHNGFRDYAWRWRQPPFAALTSGLTGLPWDGRPFGGTLLLVAEQGFGDTLQFCRLSRAARPLARHVVLEVQPELASLLRRSFPEIEIVGRSPDFPHPAHRPRHDRYAALLDLPLLLDLSVERLPADVPYLAPDPERVSRWAERVANLPREARRIGLVWAGSARADDIAAMEVDRRRSLPLAAFAPLASVADAAFVSLQLGPPAAALATSAFPVADVSRWLADFDETAALIANLDLVVTVDTAVAHLAGGLGKPVWVLSRADNCWRWLSGRNDSPWYPTLRLFRQRTPGEWGPAIRELAESLSASAGSRRGS